MSAQEPNIPYGGTTGERLKAFAVNAETRERISVLASRYWEAASYGVLLICATVLRFYNLGARAGGRSATASLSPCGSARPDAAR